MEPLKLVNSEFGDGWVEMTYADSPVVESTSRLMHFRMPVAADASASLASHYLQCLQLARDALTAEMQALTSPLGRAPDSVQVAELRSRGA